MCMTHGAEVASWLQASWLMPTRVYPSPRVENRGMAPVVWCFQLPISVTNEICWNDLWAPRGCSSLSTRGSPSPQILRSISTNVLVILMRPRLTLNESERYNWYLNEIEISFSRGAASPPSTCSVCSMSAIRAHQPRYRVRGIS